MVNPWRVVAVMAVVCAAAPAYAQKPEAAVEAAIKSALVHKTKWNGKVSDNAIVIDRNGALLPNPTNLGKAWYRDDFDDGADEMLEKRVKLSTSVEKLTVGVTKGGSSAWFSGVFSYTANVGVSEAPEKGKLRISGVLINDQGWKIRALMLTEPVADKKLLEVAAKANMIAHYEAPELSGDDDLGQAAATWFETGFAKVAASGVKLAASGTGPNESQIGGGATNLAKTWDGLKMKAPKLDARTFGNGDIGFVRADVHMPLKKTRYQTAAQLVLGAIAIKDGGTWKWVSLQYATPMGVVQRSQD